MAFNNSGSFGYNPSQSSTSMPGSFDEEQIAIARKRALMQQLANQPAVDSGYRGAHWVNPYYAQLGPAVSQGLNALAQPEMDAQLQDIAQRRSAAADEWLGQMPTDTPADPGVQGTGPIAPPPNTPGVEYDQDQHVQNWMSARAAQQDKLAQDAAINMETGAPMALADSQMQPLEPAPAAPMVPQAPQDFVPNRAATPMIPAKIGDMAKWAAKGAAFSPMHAKVAEKALDTAIAAPEKARLAAEAIAAKKEQAAELASNRRHELALKQMESASEKERDRIFKEQMLEYKAANDINKMEQMYALKEALAAGKSPPVEHTTLQGYDVVTGRPVNRAPNGTLFRAGEDGRPEAAPFVGEVMPVAAKEKEVAKVQASMENHSAIKSLLEMAETNKGAFGSSGALLGMVPGPLGVWASAKNLTEAQIQARSEFAKHAAKLTHDLYGSAFTSGEQSRAAPFIVQPSDPPEKVLANLKGMLKEAERTRMFQSNVAKQAAQARVGGGEGGGKTIVKKLVKGGKTYVLYSDGTEGVQ